MFIEGFLGFFMGWTLVLFISNFTGHLPNNQQFEKFDQAFDFWIVRIATTFLRIARHGKEISERLLTRIDQKIEFWVFRLGMKIDKMVRVLKRWF
jgi:hypothetical protein